MNTMQRIQKGFTIVELLIVVTIIGILATLVIVSYNGIQSSARDASILSDLDALDGIQVQYGIKNNTSGKAWYSGSGVDADLGFTPSPGNVIDVVVDASDYCIRGYNANSSTHKTLATALTKESTSGICSTLGASVAAINDSGGSSPTVNGGVVTTLAGSTSGYADGTGAAAKFYLPNGIAVAGDGTIYVADALNYRIRKITPAGVVTTLAGSTSGYADGTGAAAQFALVYSVAVAGDGTIYVTDAGNHRIRKITPAGVVTTLAGSTQGYADGTGAAAQFSVPYGIAVAGDGMVYVGDSSNNRIRKITPAGVVTTLAGSTQGYADGTGAAAQFKQPVFLVIDNSGVIYVSDSGNHRIRKITPAGVVTTLAGSTQGYADGTGAAAQFYGPSGISFTGDGGLYVADTYNHRIRKITSAGVVTTLAGSTSGYADGTGAAAKFYYPFGISLTGDGSLYVSDAYNHRIRKIQ